MPARRLALASVILLSAACSAGEAVSVRDAVYRPPLGQGSVSAAYLTLTSKSPDRLIGASSPAAGAIEIHTMQRTGDVVRMRRLDGVDLPAGRPVRFEPGGLHLMLIDLEDEGENAAIAITFELESGAKVTSKFERAGAGVLD